jgi:CubicO group peptidase (beta-lactamase class C family)
MILSATRISRRNLLARSIVGASSSALWSCAPWSAGAQSVSPDASPGPPQPSERAAMATVATTFMQKYAVPGLSVAIGHLNHPLYQEAFGFADRERNEALTPTHLFRIASVTKPITSVAVFSLIERGRLRLDDRIFGPDAVLGTDFGRPPYHQGVDQITIEHLLTHTCGGWNNQHDDPMFINVGLNHAELISSTLRNRALDHPPGQSFAYSNFGYCVLGRVIEKVTGQDYAGFVARTVLKRCGIDDMAIGGNTLAQRRRDEVKYYGQGDNPYGMNVTRMDSHGGWIARPSDLMQFMMHVDGFATPPNILNANTIRAMTASSNANANYAKGWSVNRFNNWWHNGSLPGTSTIAVRTSRGFCWAAFTNTRRTSSGLDGDLDKLVWDMVGQVKNWRA